MTSPEPWLGSRARWRTLPFRPYHLLRWARYARRHQLGPQGELTTESVAARLGSKRSACLLSVLVVRDDDVCGGLSLRRRRLRRNVREPRPEQVAKDGMSQLRLGLGGSRGENGVSGSLG